MKVKQILAGTLATAMIVTSLPAANMGSVSAKTAEELEVMDDAEKVKYTEITSALYSSYNPTVLTNEPSIMPDIISVPQQTLEENACANTEQWPALWTNDGCAAWAFDNTDHWWHTRYDSWENANSNEVVTGRNQIFTTVYPWIGSKLDADGNSVILHSLTYKGRNGGRSWMKDYILLTANTPGETPSDEDFKKVAEGTIPSKNEYEIILDEPVAATHFRLEARSKQEDGDADTVTAQLITAKKYDAKPVATPVLSVPMPTLNQRPHHVEKDSKDVGYTLSSVWSQNGENLTENSVIGAGSASITATLSAEDDYLFLTSSKPKTMNFGGIPVSVDAEISADRKTMTVSHTWSGKSLHTVSADYATGCNNVMGNVSVSSPGVEDGESVIFKAEAASAYYIFSGWFSSPEADADSISEDPIYTHDNTESDLILYAKFERNPFYKQADYWKEELKNGTLGTQSESDIWFYQKCEENSTTWENRDNFYPNDTTDANAKGIWRDSNCTDGSDKITISQLTPALHKVAYTWKAPKTGYYSVKLTTPGVGAANPAKILIQHALSLTEAGKTLWENNVQGINEFSSCLIAHVKKDQCIRIGTPEKNRPRWITGFFPEIDPRTAREYAVQYLQEIDEEQRNNGWESYAAVPKAKAEEAQTALQTAVNNSADHPTDSEANREIDMLICDLETAIDNMKNYVAVESITLNDVPQELTVGNSVQLTATVNPNNATYPSITWSSSNENVATVDDNGCVTTVAKGDTTITATADGQTATCTITVKAQAPTSISITKDGDSLEDTDVLWINTSKPAEDGAQTDTGEAKYQVLLEPDGSEAELTVSITNEEGNSVTDVVEYTLQDAENGYTLTLTPLKVGTAHVQVSASDDVSAEFNVVVGRMGTITYQDGNGKTHGNGIGYWYSPVDEHTSMPSEEDIMKLPDNDGYFATGATFNGEELTYAAIVEAIAAGEENPVITVIYKKKCTIAVTGEAWIEYKGKKGTSFPVPYMDRVTVKAPAMKGNLAFVGWQNERGKFVSYASSYNMAALQKSLTLTPVYENAAEKQIVFDVTGSAELTGTENANGFVKRYTITASRTVPIAKLHAGENQLISHGMLVTNGASFLTKSEQEWGLNENGNAINKVYGVTKIEAQGKGLIGSFIAGATTVKNAIYVRPYVIYNDDQGKQVVKMGEVTTISYESK